MWPSLVSAWGGVWTPRNTTLMTVDFVSVVWTAPQTVYMVGYNAAFGAIIRSTNGGYTWQPVMQGTDATSRFTDVANANGTNNFFAVSLSGAIYVSSDGMTFAQIGTSLPASLFGAAVGSNGNAYAVGVGSSTAQPSRIYRSTLSTAYAVWNDFTSKTPPPSYANVLLSAVGTFDGVTVVAVGNSGLIYTTTNAGVTWSYTFWPALTNLQCVSFGTPKVALVAGDATTLILTTDGGKTWADLTPGFNPDVQAAVSSNPNFAFHAVSMVGASVAFVSATAGIILRSVNGGGTWTLDYVSPPGYPAILSLRMSPYTGGATGVAGFQRGGQIILRYPDPSSSPTYRPSQQPARPSGQPTMYFQPTGHPTGRPSGYELTANNGGGAGYIWRAVPTGQTANVLMSAAFSKTDPRFVVVVGYQYRNGLLLYSSDGGNTFQAYTVPLLVVVKIMDVDATTDPYQNQYFVAVSNVGNVYVSSNAGVASQWNWAATASLGVSLTGVTIGTNRQAYAVASGATAGQSAGAIFTSAPPFTAWQDVSPRQMRSGFFKAVGTFDGVNVVAVGDGGLVYYSNAPGAQPTATSWVFSAQAVALGANPNKYALYCVSFGAQRVAYVGGAFATLLKTVDGGATWTSLYPALRNLNAIGIGNNVKFHAISAVSTAVVYASTDNGYVFKTNNGGASFVIETQATMPSGTAATLTCVAMYRGLYNQGGVAQTLPGAVGLAGDNAGNVYVKTFAPTASPTTAPTPRPTRPGETNPPSVLPTLTPTVMPSRPTVSPTTKSPSYTPPPSTRPTPAPSAWPTRVPTCEPTPRPSSAPTLFPSAPPSVTPTTAGPSAVPSTACPTGQPSMQPTRQPSTQPTRGPSRPSGQPTRRPTRQPTMQPTARPTRQPTSQPTRQPTRVPTSQPTRAPSRPSSQPSRQPSGRPSSQPTRLPFSRPTGKPSRQPTSHPTSEPTNVIYIEVDTLISFRGSPPGRSLPRTHRVSLSLRAPSPRRSPCTCTRCCPASAP